MDDLQVFLGLECHQAASILRRNPRVLQVSATVWRNNLRALVQELGLSPAQARDAVLAHPRLLRLATAPLLAHCARLRRAADSSPSWGAQLAQLRGRQVAAALRFDAVAWARVDYLIASGQQDAVELWSCELSDAAAFARRFPKAAQWVRRRREREAAARRRERDVARAGAAAAEEAGVVDGASREQQQGGNEQQRQQWQRWGAGGQGAPQREESEGLSEAFDGWRRVGSSGSSSSSNSSSKPPKRRQRQQQGFESSRGMDQEADWEQQQQQRQQWQEEQQQDGGKSLDLLQQGQQRWKGGPQWRQEQRQQQAAAGSDDAALVVPFSKQQQQQQQSPCAGAVVNGDKPCSTASTGNQAAPGMGRAPELLAAGHGGYGPTAHD